MVLSAGEMSVIRGGAGVGMTVGVGVTVGAMVLNVHSTSCASMVSPKASDRPAAMRAV